MWYAPIARSVVSGVDVLSRVCRFSLPTSKRPRSILDARSDRFIGSVARRKSVTKNRIYQTPSCRTTPRLRATQQFRRSSPTRPHSRSFPPNDLTPRRDLPACFRPPRSRRTPPGGGARRRAVSSTRSANEPFRCLRRAYRRRSAWTASASCSAPISTCPALAASSSAATGAPRRHRNSRNSWPLFQEYVARAYRPVSARSAVSRSGSPAAARMARKPSSPAKSSWPAVRSAWIGTSSTITGGTRSPDVYIAGVSMKVTQRDEFAAVIQRSGGQVEGLLSQLRQKLTSELQFEDAVAALTPSLRRVLGRDTGPSPLDDARGRTLSLGRDRCPVNPGIIEAEDDSASVKFWQAALGGRP